MTLAYILIAWVAGSFPLGVGFCALVARNRTVGDQR